MPDQAPATRAVDTQMEAYCRMLEDELLAAHLEIARLPGDGLSLTEDDWNRTCECSVCEDIRRKRTAADPADVCATESRDGGPGEIARASLLPGQIDAGLR